MCSLLLTAIVARAAPLCCCQLSLSNSRLQQQQWCKRMPSPPLFLKSQAYPTKMELPLHPQLHTSAFFAWKGSEPLHAEIMLLKLRHGGLTADPILLKDICRLIQPLLMYCHVTTSVLPLALLLRGDASASTKVLAAQVNAVT